MQDLTAREVASYLERSDLAIIPVGCHEAHGALMPMGTDTFIAETVALKLAERIDGLISPFPNCYYPGATKGLPGTFAMPAEVAEGYLEMIVHELIRNKFRRIMIMQWHGVDYLHWQLVRDLYDETGVPVAYFSLLRMPVVQRLKVELLDSRGECLETAVLAASLRILGKEHLLDTSIMADNQVVQDRVEEPALTKIGQAGGGIGHYYDHESQHMPFRKNPDFESGLIILEAMVDSLATASEGLREYINIIDQRSSH
jgi:creatinine amidohydrolase